MKLMSPSEAWHRLIHSRMVRRITTTPRDLDGTKDEHYIVYCCGRAWDH